MRVLLYLKILMFLVILLVKASSSIDESGCSVETLEPGKSLRLLCGKDYAGSRVEQGSFEELYFRCEDPRPVKWSLYGNLFGENGSFLKGLELKNCQNALEFLGGVQRENEALNSLRRLLITGTPLRNLPGDLPCSLSSLDLSFNDVRRLFSQSFCFKSSLRELNLAGNGIKALRGEDFLGYESLKKLNLSRNRISSLEEGAFAGVEGLTTIDLSYNLMVALPANSFVGLKRLTRLDLSGNRLVGVSSDLFQSSLVILNLAGNKLRSDLSFKNLRNLIVMDLSRNEISNLHPSLLSNSAPGLRYLDLSHNRLSKISLRDLDELRTVKLKGNSLERLDPEMFNVNMTFLNLLDLSNNEIESIHPDAFIRCATLEDLSLENNKLTYFPAEAISRIPQLKVLNIGKNRILKLGNDTFIRDMRRLIGLKLDENAIEEIGSEVFAHVPDLKVLNLSKNRLRTLSRDLFINNKELEAVRLDSNRLNDIVGLFKGLSKLNWLNISNNEIDKFDWFLVPYSLYWLDLKFNAIEEIGNYFELEEEFASLQTFDVSHNKVTFIGPKALPKNLQVLSLHDNEISEIGMHTFIDMQSLRRVDLYANKIKHLDKQSLLLSPDSKEKPEFYLGGNPFVCDCDLEWLIRVNNDSTTAVSSQNLVRKYPLVNDLESIYCLSERSESNRVIPLVESTDFLCLYETHCFSLCHCCDYDACDCEMTCPDSCRCYHDRSWSVNIVDCHSAGFEQPPTAIPMDATEVYLQGNDFRRLSSHSFIGRKNLEILFLNSSNIEVILNNTFSGLGRLRILHLENNRIGNLSGNEFMSLLSLKALYLDRNRIQHIHPKTFSYLKDLEVLKLHENKLVTFDFGVILNGLRSLRVLTLTKNRWNCSDCAWIEASRPWKNLIADSFSCFDGNDSASNAVCPPEDLGFSLDLSEKRKTIFSESNLPIIIVASSFSIVLLVFVGVIFYYRQEIRILAFDWSGLRANGAYEVEPKDYDVYVGYSAADDQWVRQILAVHLEEEEHYRLLLHQRDFHPNPQLADTILAGAEHASSLIFVISKHFVSFEWNKFEVRSAMHSVLRRRNSPNGGRKAIFVLLGDVPTRDLDPDLRLYLKSNTSIKWTDRLFWSRLRYRLPEPNSQLALGSISLQDTFYTIPYPNENSTLSNHTLLRSSSNEDGYHPHHYEQNHYFTLSSRLNGQRVYDENNLQITPKIVERTYK